MCNEAQPPRLYVFGVLRLDISSTSLKNIHENSVCESVYIVPPKYLWKHPSVWAFTVKGAIRRQQNLKRFRDTEGKENLSQSNELIGSAIHDTKAING